MNVSALSLVVAMLVVAIPLLVIAFYDCHKFHQRKRYTCGLNSKDH